MQGNGYNIKHPWPVMGLQLPSGGKLQRQRVECWDRGTRWARRAMHCMGAIPVRHCSLRVLACSIFSRTQKHIQPCCKPPLSAVAAWGVGWRCGGRDLRDPLAGRSNPKHRRLRRRDLALEPSSGAGCGDKAPLPLPELGMLSALSSLCLLLHLPLDQASCTPVRVPGPAAAATQPSHQLSFGRAGGGAGSTRQRWFAGGDWQAGTYSSEFKMAWQQCGLYHAFPAPCCSRDHASTKRGCAWSWVRLVWHQHGLLLPSPLPQAFATGRTVLVPCLLLALPLHGAAAGAVWLPQGQPAEEHRGSV